VTIQTLLFYVQLTSDDAQQIPQSAEQTVKHACSKTPSEDAKLDAEHSNEGIFVLLTVSLSFLIAATECTIFMQVFSYRIRKWVFVE